ncbi:MAG: (deoxy)nucleoside triphosphate pyrophosphohydrolase [Clostridia bacterium]
MVNVVAAVIKENDKILIAKRNLKKSQGGLWEFPGGKIEVGETSEEALIREIKEELDVNITVDKYLTEEKFIYPEKEINLIAFKAKILSGELTLNEHEQIEWIDKKSLDNYKFAPADKFIVEYLKQN